MVKRLIRWANRLLTLLEVLLVFAAVAYAAFSLWDNRQIYEQVENVTRDLREIKSLSGDDTLSLFDQLRFINPDVRSWLVMEGTGIDYPVLQGKSNFTYINADVYGDFAMVGSIFMDFRNDPGFRDPYTLLMGHDMSGHRMFSDVNLYKDEAFFRKHTTGILTLPNGEHTLLTLSCMVKSAGNSQIFNPQNWDHLTPEQVLQYAQEGALLINTEGIGILTRMLASGADTHLVALTTCSNEYSDARTILITLMDPLDVMADIDHPGASHVGDCFD